MNITDIKRKDLEADVVEAALRGDRVIVLADTLEAVVPVFQSIADAFTNEDGEVLAGVVVRRMNGRQRVEIPNGGRITFGSIRSSIRGYAANRIYTPAVTGETVTLLRNFQAILVTERTGTIVRYQDRVEA